MEYKHIVEAAIYLLGALLMALGLYLVPRIVANKEKKKKAQERKDREEQVRFTIDRTTYNRIKRNNQ